MPVNLISTVGDKDANSYASVEEADAYFAVRLNADLWTNSPVDTKAKALILATSLIDQLEFSGRKVSVSSEDLPDYQALQWPRSPDMIDAYMLGIDHLLSFRDDAQRGWLSGTGVPLIPKKLKEATFEQAFFLIRTIVGIDKRDAIRGQGMNQVSTKVGSESFTNEIPICPSTKRLLTTLYCFPNGIRLSRT